LHPKKNVAVIAMNRLTTGEQGSGGGLPLEPVSGVDKLGRPGHHGGDDGGGGTLGEVGRHHLVDLGGVAREERLHGAVAAVADPTVEPQRARRLHGPVPEEDALHVAFHLHAHRLGRRLLLRVGGGGCHGAARGAGGEGEEEPGGGGGGGGEHPGGTGEGDGWSW
jgi:hypothetical protein